jgi:hypothetical protein
MKTLSHLRVWPSVAAAFLPALIIANDSDLIVRSNQPDRQDGREAGIGVVLAAAGHYPQVIGLVPGSPAATNGALRRGTFILAIAEGRGDTHFTATRDLPVDQVAHLLRGEAGSPVSLQVTDSLPWELGSGRYTTIVLQRATVRAGDLAWLAGGGGLFRQSPAGEASAAVVALTNWWGPSTARQPDYESWKRIRVGMPKAIVQQILGRPLRVRDLLIFQDAADTWDYGCVEAASEVIPTDLTFSVGFRRGKVVSVEDPFDGVFSTNGVPTKPKLVTPVENSGFSHYPRILDLRWYPASGEYPVRYRIQLDALTAAGWATEEYESPRPFFCTTFLGCTNGRWRVRAINHLGAGDWSEYSHFEFKR